MTAIEVRGVSKSYRRYTRQRFGTLKSALLTGSLGGSLRPEQSREVLHDVSFEVPRGRTMGLIGRNGSGKSTLLKLIAGIGRPTTGVIRVEGRVSALIELGAGFHPEISGRENVFINGMMLGLSRREVAERFDDMVAFAELEEFIDAPVKTYSSGMYVRLGFAVAIHVNPDVLLVDEVLAVGDEAFTHRCLDKFAELRRHGKTVLLVTHALDLVTRFCDEALWLDDGRVREQGDPKRVVDAYLLDVSAADARALAEADRRAAGSSLSAPRGAAGDPPGDMFQASEGRWGSREVEIVSVRLAGADGTETQVVRTGEPLTVTLGVRAQAPVTDVVFGVGIFSADGTCCFGTNTSIDGGLGGTLSGEGEVTFAVERLDLIAGAYKLDVAVHREDGAPYDYHRLLHSFRVTSDRRDVGLFRPPHRWRFSGGVRMSGLS
ncbi:MAG: ABC transporter ATP-binding protein [Vicinamibacterales bacterium]